MYLENSFHLYAISLEIFIQRILEKFWIAKKRIYKHSYFFYDYLKIAISWKFFLDFQLKEILKKNYRLFKTIIY